MTPEPRGAGCLNIPKPLRMVAVDQQEETAVNKHFKPHLQGTLKHSQHDLEGSKESYSSYPENRAPNRRQRSSHFRSSHQLAEAPPKNPKGNIILQEAQETTSPKKKKPLPSKKKKPLPSKKKKPLPSKRRNHFPQKRRNHFPQKEETTSPKKKKPLPSKKKKPLPSKKKKPLPPKRRNHFPQTQPVESPPWAPGDKPCFLEQISNSPLSTQGRIAREFSKLLRDMWSNERLEARSGSG